MQASVEKSCDTLCESDLGERALGMSVKVRLEVPHTGGCLESTRDAADLTAADREMDNRSHGGWR